MHYLGEKKYNKKKKKYGELFGFIIESLRIRHESEKLRRGIFRKGNDRKY